MRSTRSKGVERSGKATGWSVRPGSSTAFPGTRRAKAARPSGSACWSWKTTWNTGERPASRSGAHRSASQGKGNAWWAKAPRTRCAASSTSASKDPSNHRARNATGLTKYPTTSATWGSIRPRAGVPTSRSRRPVSRLSQAWKAANRRTNDVTPRDRAKP